LFGLVNVALQFFVEDTYGRPIWEEVTREAKLDFRDFEAMLPYPDAITDAVLDAMSQVLGKDQQTVLHDLGTYLVTNDNMDVVRRLLRYGGGEFEDFLISLDELSDRVRLSLPDLDMPQLTLQPHGDGSFTLKIDSDRPGYGALLMGIVQALADDYGALVLAELQTFYDDGQTRERIEIELVDIAFSQDRGLDLGAGLRRQ
jgi:hypothetical protein